MSKKPIKKEDVIILGKQVASGAIGAFLSEGLNGAVAPDGASDSKAGLIRLGIGVGMGGLSLLVDNEFVKCAFIGGAVFQIVKGGQKLLVKSGVAEKVDSTTISGKLVNGVVGLTGLNCACDSGLAARLQAARRKHHKGVRVPQYTTLPQNNGEVDVYMQRAGQAA